MIDLIVCALIAIVEGALVWVANLPNIFLEGRFLWPLRFEGKGQGIK